MLYVVCKVKFYQMYIFNSTGVHTIHICNDIHIVRSTVVLHHTIYTYIYLIRKLCIIPVKRVATSTSSGTSSGTSSSLLSLVYST